MQMTPACIPEPASWVVLKQKRESSAQSCPRSGPQRVHHCPAVGQALAELTSCIFEIHELSAFTPCLVMGKMRLMPA